MGNEQKKEIKSIRKSQRMRNREREIKGIEREGVKQRENLRDGKIKMKKLREGERKRNKERERDKNCISLFLFQRFDYDRYFCGARI